MRMLLLLLTVHMQVCAKTSLQLRVLCTSVRVRLCTCVRGHVEGIKNVMQDYPAGRLPTSSAEE